MENCKSCKKEFSIEEMVIMDRYKKKDGLETIRYYCRDCNNTKTKKYISTETGKNNLYKAIYKSIAKHRSKTNARQLLHYHLKQGNIIKPNYCEICDDNVKLQAHHTDYTKPLDVMWVCIDCHCLLDRLNN